MARIKKEQEEKNNKTYYKVMLKAGFFSRWKEEFGSYDKKQADNMFRDIATANNIKIKN